ncbi:MAG: hypothetical protein H0U98_15380 [Alphaproteobacteria bacterium]|nr:hypothetical protein [Alphaproteobacteria bacterium]
MTRYFLALLMAVISLPALAQPPEPAPVPTGRACLQQGNIHDYQYVAGSRSLIVTDTARVRYRLTFISKCYDIDRQFGLRFKGRGVGRLSCVAQGDSMLVQNGGSTRECIVREVEYETPFLDRADLAAMSTRRLR